MIVGFSGASTIPHVVGHSLASFISARVLEDLAPEAALRNTIVNDVTLLKSSPCVFIVPGPADATRPVATQIGHHHPPDRVWGVELELCGTENCSWSFGDSLWDSSEPFDKARLFCVRCKRKSHVIYRDFDLPSVQPWGASHPRVFRSVFPLPLSELCIARKVPERSQKEVERLKQDKKQEVTRLRHEKKEEFDRLKEEEKNLGLKRRRVQSFVS